MDWNDDATIEANYELLQAIARDNGWTVYEVIEKLRDGDLEIRLGRWVIS